MENHCIGGPDSLGEKQGERRGREALGERGSKRRGSETLR
jgi:hypothetical protein